MQAGASTMAWATAVKGGWETLVHPRGTASHVNFRDDRRPRNHYHAIHVCAMFIFQQKPGVALQSFEFRQKVFTWSYVPYGVHTSGVQQIESR